MNHLPTVAGRFGLSAFVSVGNKADISGNDLLECWEHDPQTDVILLYLESFGNPRRFARIALRVSQTKPIVAEVWALLDCYDLAALKQLLLRLSALVEAHPEVVEMDANPVIAGPCGAVIVDARIRLAAAAASRPARLALIHPGPEGHLPLTRGVVAHFL